MNTKRWWDSNIWIYSTMKCWMPSGGAWFEPIQFSFGFFSHVMAREFFYLLLLQHLLHLLLFLNASEPSIHYNISPQAYHLA